MKLYPWLIQSYKNIIKQHQIKKAHHAILINTQKGMGAFELIWNISKWLLCQKPIGIHFCNICNGCKLMSSQNHPDWHNVVVEKNNLISIDTIHNINYQVFKCSQQGGAKIFFISDMKKLTESSMNALLKTLEEPPLNTWFFIVSYQHLYTCTTLISRCTIYYLHTPPEQKIIFWLKKEKNEKNEKNISYLTALRINKGSPLSAKKFIDSELWHERIHFYKNLYESLQNKNLLSFLAILKNGKIIKKIDWICLLLFDAIKFNLNEKNNLSNLDHIKFIQMLSDNYSNHTLDFSIRSWIKCKYRLNTISGINNELLLIEQLLVWEKILNFFYTS